MTATAPSSGCSKYSETLPCAPCSAKCARALVREALAAWGLEQLVGDGATVVSELVGNAVVHTRSRDVVVSVVRLRPGLVRIEVVDGSRALPSPRVAGDDDVEGRGLALVEELTCRWGTDLTPRCGKSVWGELCSVRRRFVPARHPGAPGRPRAAVPGAGPGRAPWTPESD